MVISTDPQSFYVETGQGVFESTPAGGHSPRLADRQPVIVYARSNVAEAADNRVYQVGRKSFVFFRNPRPDATDPQTGERYLDVIVFWVPSEADNQALVQDAWLSRASAHRAATWLSAQL